MPQSTISSRAGDRSPRPSPRDTSLQASAALASFADTPPWQWTAACSFQNSGDAAAAEVKSRHGQRSPSLRRPVGRQRSPAISLHAHVAEPKQAPYQDASAIGSTRGVSAERWQAAQKIVPWQLDIVEEERHVAQVAATALVVGSGPPVDAAEARTGCSIVSSRAAAYRCPCDPWGAGSPRVLAGCTGVAPRLGPIPTAFIRWIASRCARMRSVLREPTSSYFSGAV